MEGLFGVRLQKGNPTFSGTHLLLNSGIGLRSVKSFESMISFRIVRTGREQPNSCDQSRTQCFGLQFCLSCLAS
jgi:hypothetical protein